MLILKIKQAEKALADGRLDEACDLLQAPALRAHCRGQELAGRLSRALVERGQNHLQQGHLPQALSDCKKADQINGNSPDVTTLRQAVCDAMDQRFHAGQKEQQLLAQARKQLDNGRLSVGESLLRETPDQEGRAGLLSQEAHVQRLESDDIRKSLERALAQDDLDQALSCLTRDWDTIVNSNGRYQTLFNDIKKRALRQIQKDFSDGRVRRAQAWLGRLLPMVHAGDPVEEFALGVNACVQAMEAIEKGQLASAVQRLRQATTLLPSISWLEKTLKLVQNAANQIDDLNTGPLGLLERTEVPTCVPAPGRPEMPVIKHDPIPRKHLTQDDSPVPETTGTWLLSVDGVGSYLVYTDPQLTVGPISSSDRPMLGLLADPALPTITIARTEEDYFLQSTAPVRVDQAPVRRTLLADGQRICLSNRCRLKFNRPNAASTTATLSVTGGRLPRNDIRYAIMMDDCLLIGDSVNHHVRAADTSHPITLLHENGRFTCQTQKPICTEGRVLSTGTPLPLNQTITIGDVSLVLTRA